MDQPSRAWLLYACRSPYSAEVAEIVWRAGGTVRCLVDNLGGEPICSPIARVVTPDALDDDDRAADAVIPLLTPGHRYAVEQEARSLGIGHFPALVDPSAIVARTARVDDGAVLNCAAVVAANAVVGRFVHVNRSASIGHDVVLRPFVTIGPAAVLAGHVEVRSGAFVGAGAVITPGTVIGENAVVGAGAVVVRDVPPFTTVVGNPARVVREADVWYGAAAVRTAGAAGWK